MSTTFELCAERLTPRAMLASTHSLVAAHGGLGATRQGGCCRIVLPYSVLLSRRHRAGYLDRDLSWIGSGTDLYGYGGSPECAAAPAPRRFGIRYPAGAES